MNTKGFMAFSAAAAAAAFIAIATHASAQQMPTEDEMEQFKKLSPEQQAQVKQIVGSSRLKNKATDNRTQLVEPEVVTPAELTDEAAENETNDEAEGGSKSSKGDESSKTAKKVKEPSSLELRYARRTDAANLDQSPLTRAVRQQLKQFGYDLFAGTPTTFAPATDIPVPSDYLIGPGDVLEVQLYGKENEQYSLGVSRDGQINFPEIGAIAVAGMRFADVRADLEKRVNEQMIGVKASISMGPLRSVRVFVLGDVTRPGSYTVSSLSTMTNALFVSGGVKSVGSLRNVQLKRNGRIVARLDLYDLLLRGDTSNDARLAPGDVIFVPPIGLTAGVAGEVRRPAIYELRGEKTAKQLVELAGGLLPTAVSSLSQLERLSKNGSTTLLDLDLDAPGAQQTAVFDGDVLRIYEGLDRMEGLVLLSGHVRRPGGVAWHERMRLTDLIPSVDTLLPQPDLEYVVIRREEKPLAKISVFSARLSQAWSAPNSDANVFIQPRDEIFVFAATFAVPKTAIPASLSSYESDFVRKTLVSRTERAKLLRPVLDRLEQQAGGQEPTRIINVGGLVRSPGDFPLEANMRLSDAIRASGGLSEAAYTLDAEVTRYDVSSGKNREINHVKVDLARVIQGDGSADIELQPHDEITIKRLPEWVETQTAELQGEVRFPGVYPIKRGERLSALIARAGGLTDQAFSEGSIFTREELRVKEQERFDRLAEQLEADIAAASLEKAQENAQQAEALSSARTLLPQLRNAKATGRLVIDLPELIADGPKSGYDVVLKGGDRLVVPSKTQEVTVIGEVQYPTSHLLEDGLGASDYITRSGGLTYKGDASRAYVVRANGQVEPISSGWLFHTESRVKPGDTIVVPLDVERIRPLTFWTSVTQILYQLAVTLAVVSNVTSL